MKMTSIYDIKKGAVLQLENSIKATITICHEGCVVTHFTDGHDLDVTATVYYEGNGLIHPQNENDIGLNEKVMAFESASDMLVIFKFLALVEKYLE